MSPKLTAVLIAVIAVAVFVGCDATGTHRIDGEYAVGRVDFNFGAGNVWTLYDVLLIVDTSERMIYFDGFETPQRRWIWAGSYRRSGNRVVAQDLPEIDYGSNDQLDLHLEFTSTGFGGAAINWVYRDDELWNVGAARISGQRQSRIGTRDAGPAEKADDRQLKFEALD